MQRVLPFIILCFAFMFSTFVKAEDEDRDLDQIEAEIKKSEIKVQPEQKQSQESQEVKVQNLSDLSKLQAFNDISVLEKRFMPKSMRFQMFGAFSSQVNDPWNTITGGNLRAAFGLTEAWGLEVSNYFLSNTTSQGSKDLFEQHDVNARSSFGVGTGYTGAHVMWTPIYGKLSLFNKRIIPFDMYFTAGGGTTNLEGTSVKTAPTTSIGAGQIFALTKSVSFRWDVTWNIYTMPFGSVNSLLLSFGAGLYIPEAKYR